MQMILKIFKIITGREDQQSLQHDLTHLSRWSDDEMLKFHPDKFKKMTIVLANETVDPYYLTSNGIEHIIEEVES